MSKIKFKTRIDPKDCKHLPLRGKTGIENCPDCLQRFVLRTVKIEAASNTRHKAPFLATQGVPTNDLGWYQDESVLIGDPL